jgi:DNA polymerase-3 subunit delta'
MDNISFNKDIGHFKIQERILNSINNNRLPHALLFHGKQGTGKAAFAIEVAKLLNCDKGPLNVCQKCPHCIKIDKLTHPDVKFIFPAPSTTGTKPEEIAEALQLKAANPYRRVSFAGKNSFISIDAVRELKYDAKFKLYEGKKKLFIIEDADEMRPEAANALLKILEEPPLNLALLLTTSKLSRILPTIRSRSQLIYFPPLEGDEVLKIIKKYSKDTPEHLAKIIRLSMGNIKFAFEFIEEDILLKRDQAIDFLRKIVIIEKTHELSNQIATLTASRDRRNMTLILFFLLTWFHDAFHFKINPQQTNYLINSDLQENLTGFVTGYPKANYQGLIETTQKAIQELEDVRNLNPILIFTNLSIKLNRMIKHR